MFPSLPELTHGLSPNGYARFLRKGSVAQWLARRTRDPAVAGSIPTLRKQFTYISSVHPSANGYPAIGGCIDY